MLDCVACYEARGLAKIGLGEDNHMWYVFEEEQHQQDPRLLHVLMETDDYDFNVHYKTPYFCLLYTSPSPRDGLLSRMPSSA